MSITRHDMRFEKVCEAKEKGKIAKLIGEVKPEIDHPYTFVKRSGHWCVMKRSVNSATLCKFSSMAHYNQSKIAFSHTATHIAVASTSSKRLSK